MQKQIKGYSNYFIEDTGELYNNNTKKYLKGKIRLNGYRVFTLSKDNKKTDFYAHRLVAEYFLNNPNNLPVVNHIDGNKCNNKKDNLEWTSYAENTKHAYSTGLATKTRTTREKFVENLPDEQWKIITDYSNYKISTCGRVLNINTNYLLKPSYSCGYYLVTLSKNNIKKKIGIHRLVYYTFNNLSIEGRDNKVIDHIDGNKLNNNLNNLREITESENVLNSYYGAKTNGSIKPVLQLTLNDEFIAEFPSCAAAARALNLDSSVISKVCRGVLYKSHGGFHFKYKE